MTDTRSTPQTKKPPSAAQAKIEVWLAAILMLISFGVGLVVRGAMTDQSPPAIEQPVSGLPPGVIAPPLTQQQLQGGLPAGHPTVAPGETAPGVPGIPAASPSPKKNQNNNNP